MRLPNIKLKVLGKLAVAAVALVALVALPVRGAVPGISLGNLILYCVAGLAVTFVLLVFVAVCSSQFSQFILRMGGTAAQWFWFSSEPRGLTALRKGQSVDKGEP